MADFITDDQPIPDQPFVTNDEVIDTVPKAGVVQLARQASAGMHPSVEPTPQESWLDTTAAGRILDHFYQGGKDAWGENVTFSPETQDALAKAGLANDTHAAYKVPLRSFNQGFLQGSAAIIDGGFFNVLAGSAAEGVSQIIKEAGWGDTLAGQVKNDILNAPTVLAAHGMELGASVKVAKGVRDTADNINIAAKAAEVYTKSMEGQIADRVRKGANTLDLLGGTESEFLGLSDNFRDIAPGLPKDVSKQGASVSTTSPRINLNASAGKYTDEAGNINMANIVAPNDVRGAIEEASQRSTFAGDITTRGQVTLQQTAQLAVDIGMKPEDLLKRNIGDAWNAEQIVAARNLLVDSATSLRDLARKAQNGGDNELSAFMEQLDRHSLIQEQVAGLTSEAGRALSSFRIAARGTEGIKALLEEAGDGYVSMRAMADRVALMEEPSQISKFVRDSNVPTLMDKVQEVWINGLLSGPRTHVTNILSNTGVALWRPLETTGAGIIGQGKEWLTGKGGDRVYIGEGAAKMWGLVQGQWDAVKAAGKAFITEEPARGASKMELQRRQAIAGVTGKAVRIPGRLLLSEDEYFKTLATRGSLNAQAYAQATQEGLKWNKFWARVSELSHNPTESMLKKAELEAEYDTFTKPLGTAGKKMQGAINAMPVSKFVVPFFRTPVNILKFAGERLPISPASKEVRAILGGRDGARAQQEQWSKLILGSSVTAAMATMAAKGYITGGGPIDPNQNALWRQEGHEPYSIRIGDANISMARLEPWGTMLGIAADMQNAASHYNDMEASDIAVLMAKSASQNLFSKTWLQGISTLIEAMEDPQNKGAAWLQGMVASAIPTGVAQVAGVEDPYLKDARTMADVVNARIPGRSESVFNKRNLWGNEIKREGSIGPDILSPLFVSTDKHDPVLEEMDRLKIYPAQVDRAIRGIKLNPQQYDDYARIAGRLTHATLQSVTSTKGWNNFPDWVKADVYNRIISKTRETARAQVLLMYPQIMIDSAKAKLPQITGTTK